MNKKTLAVIATGLALGLSQAKAQYLTVKTNFAYQSEYVFRGVQLATESFQPSIEFGYDAFYLGLWTNSRSKMTLAMKSTSSKAISTKPILLLRNLGSMGALAFRYR